MSLLLAIETATEICSVGIIRDGLLIGIKEEQKPYSHASAINLLIQELLEELQINFNQLSAIAVSSGPGSYTALRIGSSTAKGICYGLDIPLIVVDTLQSLASSSRAPEDGPDYLYCPMIDARRMEVYTALFNKDLEATDEIQAKILEEQSFDNYFKEGKTLVFSGNGAPKFQEVLDQPNAIFREIKCSAKNLVTLAHQSFEAQRFSDPAYFSPKYIKAPNITTPKKVL